MAMLPDFTAFMISSSLLIRVEPKNCMSSSPCERFAHFLGLPVEGDGGRFRHGVEMRHHQLLGFGAGGEGREAAGEDAGHAAFHEAAAADAGRDSGC